MDIKKQHVKPVKNFLLTLLFGSMFLCATIAAALPEGGSIAAGSGSIAGTGNSVEITQNSQKMIINWQGFNTAGNEQVKFIQPGANAIALNRITSGLPTIFQGLLTANGQVWIVNPAGVLFTSTSRVDVGGLLATTLNIQDNDFMAGNYSFQSVPGMPGGAVINDGEIIARGGDVAGNGLVALVAPGVENNGVIRANLGKVALASGNAFTLDFYGDSLIHFATGSKVTQTPVSPDGRVIKNAVSNNGMIEANGGKVYMTAHAASEIVENVVSMAGVIEAKTVTQGKNGVIILGGDEGQMHVSGVINVSAGQKGNAGSIIIKGHKTIVTGKLKARGGSESGNGGFIETSGHYLNVNGMQLDASAPNGTGGTWLLDPYNIRVVAGTGTTNNDGPPGFNPNGDDSIIGVDLINAQLNAGISVTLTADSIAGSQNGDITIDAPINKLVANGAALTLNALNNITINQPITLPGTGNLTLTGLGDMTFNAAVDVGGNAYVGTLGAIIFNSPLTVGQDLTLIASNGMYQTGTAPLTVSGSAIISMGSSLSSPGAVINLDNPNNDFMNVVNFSTPDGADATISDINDFTLGSVFVTGNLTVNAGGAVMQAPEAVTQTQRLTVFSSNGIDLPSSNNAVQSVVLFNSGNGDIIFNNNQPLTVREANQAGSGNISITSNGNMTVSTGDITANTGNVSLTASGGNIHVLTNIHAFNGDILFNSPVIITTSETVNKTFDGNTITFGSTLDSASGNEGLTLNVNNNAIFNGAIGQNMPLAFLTVNGPSIFNTGNITTNGNQTYNGPMTVNQDINLNASNTGNITFNGAVNAAPFLFTIVNANNVNAPAGINSGNFVQQQGQGISHFAGGLQANDIMISTNTIDGAFTGNTITLLSLNGINGSANAMQLFLGGSGGSDLINTIVNGNEGIDAASVTQLLSDNSGEFFVNGFLAGTQRDTVNNTPDTPVMTDDHDVPADLSNDLAFNQPAYGNNTCISGQCGNAEIVIDDDFKIAAGYVSCMLGFATAVDNNGHERILLPGDAVYADEKIMTEGMSQVSIKYTNGKTATIPAKNQYQVQPDVVKT